MGGRAQRGGAISLGLQELLHISELPLKFGLRALECQHMLGYRFIRNRRILREQERPSQLDGLFQRADMAARQSSVGWNREINHGFYLTNGFRRIPQRDDR